MRVDSLVEALDDLVIHRSPPALVTCLSTLEKLVAQSCSTPDSLNGFVKLQDRIDCNIASRLSLHLAYTQNAFIDALSSSRDGSEVEALVVSSTQALNILQGMALLHSSSKSLLGRPSFLKVLLDMLAMCRQPLMTMSNGPSAPSTPSSSNSPATSSRAPLMHANLAIAVLDVLLCLLVDAPVTMRAFEAAHGIEAVVKTLKRAETSRDVRVKCLEFLYFYLLPEDSASLHPQTASNSDTTDTQPLAPLLKGIVGETKLGSSATSTSPRENPPIFSTPPSSPSKSAFTKSTRQLEPRTPSGSKSHLRSERPSQAASRTPSPKKQPSIQINVPPPLPCHPHLAMINPDMEYVPISPQKAQVSALGVGHPRKPSPASFTESEISDGASSSTAREPSARLAGLGLEVSTPGAKKAPRRLGPTQSMPEDALGRKGSFARLDTKPLSKSSFLESPSRPSPRPLRERGPVPHPRTPSSRPSAIFSKSTTISPNKTAAPVPSPKVSSPTKESFSPSKSRASSPTKSPAGKSAQPAKDVRTTEEKKAMLGAWLGNVDALVQGVQRAGIWGLEGSK